MWISTWVSRILKVDIYHILCWYHLCKRVYEGLSGVGASKKERRQLELEVLGLLWKGNASEAITLLRSLLPRCRIRDRVENLIDYLVRKRSQIADYEKRHEQGLWIASTRVERWNDIAVSERCKGRGMSWVDTGVLAIALHASEKNALFVYTPRKAPLKRLSSKERLPTSFFSNYLKKCKNY